MKKTIDTALKAYENSGVVIQMKARVLFALFAAILVFIPIVLVYSFYTVFFNPAPDAPKNISIVITIFIEYLLFIAVMVLLVRGRFKLSSHLAVIVILAFTWLVMFVDVLPPVPKLDTIVYIIGILTLLPLTEMNRPYVILIYGAVNLAIFILFAVKSIYELGLPFDTLVEYIADNTVAMVAVTIIAFSVYRINVVALERAASELKERDIAEMALRTSEEKYRTLANNIPDIVYSVDRDGVVININEDPLRQYGYAPDDIIGRSFLRLIHPDDAQGIVDHYRKSSMEKRKYTEGLVFRIVDSSGGIHWMELHSHSTYDGMGKFIRDEGVLRDISDRRAADEQIRNSLKEKEVLLKEIHHRVKNNFQVIISLLNLQSDSISDESAFRHFNEAANRIRAMAFVHERLYQSENLSMINFSDYISTIMEELNSYYNTNRKSITIAIETEEVNLNIEQAIPCGLIINELVTNAFKYAFPGEAAGGSISIMMLRREDDTVKIRISDNGIGLPDYIDENKTSTLGLHLVTLLVSQLGGSYHIDRHPGTAWTVIFPLKK